MMPSNKTPLALRLAGIWMIWSSWCSVSGWLLSIVHQLDGLGYAALSPVLIGCAWWWLKATASRAPVVCDPFRKIIRRLLRPAPMVFLVIALLSMVAGILYPPWSFDAVSYRLPRILYWWQAHHWYWIGTLDHRLDFSSLGFEWQMLPIIVLTRTDRFLFLLNWLPFLLMPSLLFLAFRALGVNGRSARRWMWLAPSGYCFALQCSGIHNDGYSVNYLLAAVAFASRGFYTRQPAMLWQSVLGATLLTGAKLSNLPLLLPLGVLLLPAVRRVRLIHWTTPAVLTIILICSFAPLTWLCWKNTGDWAGDPNDQWTVKVHRPAGAVAANAVILLNDITQPPYFPGSQTINAHLEKYNKSAFLNWLELSNREFTGIHYGAMAYESGAGPGIGIGFYTAILFMAGISGRWRDKPIRRASPTPGQMTRPLSFTEAAKIVPWLAWISYLVFLASLGSYLSARIAAPYYPLLIIPLLRCRSVAAFERERIAGFFAVLAAAIVLPVIILTPARPLLPIQAIARITHRSGLEKVAEEYHFWDGLRRHLAPLRDHLLSDCDQLGYAGAFLVDSPYELFKPFGGRTIVELGLPIGRHPPLPPNLKYAVVTSDGLEQRYGMDLPSWLAEVHGRVIFQCPINAQLSVHEPARLETWYLVQIND